MDWLNWLQGKKTYIIVILAAVFNIGVVFGFWTVDSTVWSFINSILGFLGLGTLRAGVTKSAPNGK
jgi:uncharacterized membrane protein